MSATRGAVRISLVVSVLTLVVAVIGFAITLILNLFVLDEYNAYGEVPIPGSGSLQLPAGQVTVSFHTEVISSPSGGGLPVPQLGMRIDPPDGVPDPAVAESYGNTRTVNNDAHVQVWVVQVPAAGTYSIKTDGQVNGYISWLEPRTHNRCTWAFAASASVGAFEVYLRLAASTGLVALCWSWTGLGALRYRLRYRAGQPHSYATAAPSPRIHTHARLLDFSFLSF
ncbi:hypothetical protein [Mycobacterium celatum]|uniref:Uncharacterized protein n=1 Tax=Mycobacterium celatum TaxID=28045 RepID=A0A1X1RS09_MYCCE|nr:hypothetical protein [Mycobacterium celatum]ORV14107.1 hypothetical protein AWB95_11130 [Mycobacterium celatum]PIB75825.1 hypothetical protein CQY23_19060 [Mycobacterium celatum]